MGASRTTWRISDIQIFVFLSCASFTLVMSLVILRNDLVQSSHYQVKQEMSIRPTFTHLLPMFLCRSQMHLTCGPWQTIDILSWETEALHIWPLGFKPIMAAVCSNFNGVADFSWKVGILNIFFILSYFSLSSWCMRSFTYNYYFLNLLLQFVLFLISLPQLFEIS